MGAPHGWVGEQIMIGAVIIPVHLMCRTLEGFPRSNFNIQGANRNLLYKD